MKALFITAHPDDVEGFCGGFVKKLSATGTQVISVVVANGSRGNWGKAYKQMSEKEIVAMRTEESLAAAKILGIEKVIFLGFPDRGVKPFEDLIASLKKIIQEFGPDQVISFETKKYLNFYPHPDHIATARATIQALKELSDVNVKIWLSTTILPNRFVDVTQEYPDKLKAIAMHKSQQRLLKRIFPILVYIPNRFWGMLRRTKQVEAYRVISI